ncbi:MAG: polysaccharide biosynthesis protein [Eubacteriales bacterium]|nr:polysaccharide biosynthesis protein [Eubacteriales bacterium]
MEADYSPGLNCLVIGEEKLAAGLLRELSAPELGRNIVSVWLFDSNQAELEFPQTCALRSIDPAACELAELEAEISEAEVDELYLCLCEESCALESAWLERLQRLKISSYIIHEAAVDLKRRLAFYRASEEILEPKLLARPRFYGLHSETARFDGLRILITGAAGSIASKLAEDLIDSENAELHLLDHDENELYLLYRRLERSARLRSKLHCHLISIQNQSALETLFLNHHFDLVIHAAAHKHVPMMENHADEVYRNNCRATRDLFQLALEQGTSRFVFISTDKACRPKSLMGMSKAIAEYTLQEMLRNFRLAIKSTGEDYPLTQLYILRLVNVLNSKGSVLRIWEDGRRIAALN